MLSKLPIMGSLPERIPIMKQVKITIDQLKTLVRIMERDAVYGCMDSIAYVSISPRGELQFEQPCGYADCDSHYFRYA